MDVDVDGDAGAVVASGFARRGAGPAPTLAPADGTPRVDFALERAEGSRTREHVLAETERGGVTGAYGGDLYTLRARAPSGSAAAKPAEETTLFMSYAARPDAPATGKEAVELSKALTEMKGVTLMGQSSSVAVDSRKVVDGRSFQLQGGVWKEALERKQEGADDKKPRKTLKIKYLSDAYFELVKLRPDLKKVLALGEKVEFNVNDIHVVIGPEGKENLTKAELDAMAKKPSKKK
jgi:hypothetical protein